MGLTETFLLEYKGTDYEATGDAFDSIQAVRLLSPIPSRSHRSHPGPYDT